MVNALLKGGNYGMEALYGSGMRCHFSWVLGRTVCVNLDFQPGICNEDDNVIDDCFECICTFTKFRRCKPIEDCLQGKAKPGDCPKAYTTFPNVVQHLCITQKNQDCYTDYGCPGEKKCCKMANCFLGCTNPVL
nr:unnamed protein product [Callosobruchus analis]